MSPSSEVITITLIYAFLILEIVPFGLALLNLIAWPKVTKIYRSRASRVSVLIPARNEEANLPGCLETVLKQGDMVVEVLIYDDHSTDGTSAIIEDCARQDPRINPVERVPLAEGWCGKNFACAQMAAAAKGDWLLFIDADARLSEGAVARMVEEMESRQLKFLSCWPRLEMESFWERTLLPMLNFVVFTLFPAPFSLRDFRPSLALAHGACLMFDRESYHRIGGHAAVHDQIFEDVRLAQLWRQHHERGACLDGQEIVRVRMYTSLKDIWSGFQKNFFPAFRHELSFWAFIAFHSVAFLSPSLLPIVESDLRLITIPGIVLLTRLALALYFRHPLWSVLLHPLSEAILIMIGLSSWWRCKSGRGVEWRGRRYRQDLRSREQ